MRCCMNGCGPGVPAFLALTPSTCYEGLCQEFSAKQAKRLRGDAIHTPSRKEVVPCKKNDVLLVTSHCHARLSNWRPIYTFMDTSEVVYAAELGVLCS
jgi:hypothetical protein